MIDDASAAGEEGDHLPITNVVRLFIIGLADQEERPWLWIGFPAGPRPVSVAKTLLHTKHGHQRPVERECAIEVFDPNEDVREQA